MESPALSRVELCDVMARRIAEFIEPSVWLQTGDAAMDPTQNFTFTLVSAGTEPALAVTLNESVSNVDLRELTLSSDWVMAVANMFNELSQYREIVDGETRGIE